MVSGIVDILGIRVSAQTMAGAVDAIATWVSLRRNAYVCVADVHCIVRAGDDPTLKAVYDQADMVTTDGMPLVWLCRRAGYHDIERVYGPDLMLEVCRHGVAKGWRHLFYGTDQQTLGRLSETLAQRFPGLMVADAIAPPFRPLSAAEDAAIVARIAKARPDIVWVGLGAPKQEHWMAGHRGRIDAVMVGVGAAFDFHAGTKPQAPAWMRRNGLEWLFRLATEPRRLARRYLICNSLFLWRLVTRLLSGGRK